MANNAKQKYIEGLATYHKRLEAAIQTNYGIDTEYLEVISWGYHTTAIYAKSTDNKEFLLKLADWSENKEVDVLRDIDVSNRLRSAMPTPMYIKNLSGNYTFRFEDKILRLSHYISGLSPLKMDFDILGQMVDLLKTIHSFKILHGDLTPHNVLISFGEIVAVMDFEMSSTGPREWDLARTAFFSWNYMSQTAFDKVAQFVLEKYADTSIESDLFYKYVVENAQKHLASVKKHREDYDQQEDWERDCSFAKKQLELITTI